MSDDPEITQEEAEKYDAACEWCGHEKSLHRLPGQYICDGEKGDIYMADAVGHSILAAGGPCDCEEFV